MNITYGAKRSKKPQPPSTSTLAMPESGEDGFMQAAAFYDSFGSNHHAKNNGSPNPEANTAGVIADTAALGIRHLRDTVVASFFDSVFWYWREFYQRLRERNLALPAGQQPIFVSQICPGTYGWQPWTHRPVNVPPEWTPEEWMDIWRSNSGRQHRDGGFNLIPNGTTTEGASALWPNPWNVNDPEQPWGTVGSFEGNNEPANGAIMTLSEAQQMKPWMKVIRDIKNQQTATAFDGLPVVTEQGIQSNVKVNQIPVVGPSVIYSTTAEDAGDYTTPPLAVDCGNQHFYASGEEPAEESWDFSMEFDHVSGCYSGALRNPPDLSKKLPWFITEYGYPSRGIDIAQFGSHTGHWPAPDDVNAEYTIRNAVHMVRHGVRRHFQYTLYDQSPSTTSVESNWGLLRVDRSKKPQFYAVRNMLSLVTFQEAPLAARRAIPYTITGFTSVGSHGGGVNRHISMQAAPVGSSYRNSNDVLMPLLLQQNANTYILIIARTWSLWERERGHYNTAGTAVQEFGNIAGGRHAAPQQTLTVTFPEGISTAQWAQPTNGIVPSNTSPNPSWPDPEQGRTWFGLGITGGGTQVQIPITAYTKLIKVTT